MNNKNVLIGMSGGVDSSVAAHLLQQSGYNCIGCTMKLWCGNAEENTRDAEAVARRMGIPFWRSCSTAVSTSWAQIRKQ